MDTIVLSNGYELPIIGAGTFPYKEELNDVIPQLIESGYCLIDTSDNYFNEINVGCGIKKLSMATLKRVKIVTKYSDPLKAVKEAFFESAKKIYQESCMPNKTPDIYLMHWPYPHLWKRRWAEMEELYIQGYCRAIGVCNFTEKYLKEMLATCRIKPMINQIECHPMFQQRETIELCNSEKIKVISYSPLARMNERLFSEKELINIANAYNKSVGQIILSWNICQGRIPIPASSKMKHIKENFEAQYVCLSDDDLRKIDSLERGMRIRLDPDTRFSRDEIDLFHSYSLEQER